MYQYQNCERYGEYHPYVNSNHQSIRRSVMYYRSHGNLNSSRHLDRLCVEQRRQYRKHIGGTKLHHHVYGNRYQQLRNKDGYRHNCSGDHANHFGYDLFYPELCR